MKCIFKKFIFLLLILELIFPSSFLTASTKEEIEEEIAKRNRQIEELQQQIEIYNQELAKNKEKQLTIKEEIKRLTVEIRKSELEIKALSLAIEGLNLQIKKTENQLKEVEAKINRTKSNLKEALLLLRDLEQRNFFEVLVSKPNLSSFFNEFYDLYFLQSSIKRRVSDLKEVKNNLEELQEKLSDEFAEKQKLKSLEEIAKGQMVAKHQQQKKILARIQKEGNQLITKIKMAEIDLGRLKEQITYLIKAGVSVDEAVRYGQLAAIRLGIRPAFLIAILEIESRLGLNLGKGNWRTDMHPRDRDAFLAITSKLNLDPDKTPVSKAPKYGWGGAMGPAQFLPTTWLAYESEIARLTGHNPPSPWNIEDAFTAAALKLARHGATAKTRESEIAAAKAYISGSPTCSRPICLSYANAVMDKAEEIEADLNNSP
jgi:membrane-bound lytic murein transglycosylase B